MKRPLPSLNALRAFETTARHSSFVPAADELHVTPAAVKQLVRKLEEHLGIALVERSGRGLKVTPAGRVGLESLTAGFLQIERAVGQMRDYRNPQRLVVSAEPSFATAWLVPRLERFRAMHPDIDVLIDSSLRLADLERGAADVAIRFGVAPEKGDVAYRLFDEKLCAFCSPSLTSRHEGLRQLDDLSRATLIHWDTSALTWATATRAWVGWEPWLETLGAGHIDARRGVSFSDYNLAVQAAIAGQGVVLGSLPILSDLVAAGLLVRAFPDIVETSIGYDIVATRDAIGTQQVQSFIAWTKAEAAAAGHVQQPPAESSQRGRTRRVL
ncbi:LysR substrate-binding domain-containing protein [Halomonas sp. LR5S13]|uniref:LysR substrate-binding domain-containing protein n=1 Tax=Halomonas rhizosphaerae TaxID=3043296 RepID=UPI0024A92A81|nr:LysR substrate-binding domain-containing protein [Halomonas rhizosphaerae]MDI5921155.1 LysR substrate-binding domain-containing protein [Halomonas rhizosphaerae]